MELDGWRRRRCGMCLARDRPTDANRQISPAAKDKSSARKHAKTDRITIFDECYLKNKSKNVPSLSHVPVQFPIHPRIVSFHFLFFFIYFIWLSITNPRRINKHVDTFSVWISLRRSVLRPTWCRFLPLRYHSSVLCVYVFVHGHQCCKGPKRKNSSDVASICTQVYESEYIDKRHNV